MIDIQQKNGGLFSYPDRRWWKEAEVYQIYVRSFNDSNGDGVGDIRGIIEKVDYIAALGIDVVWLNPVYDSPQYDNGYDIRDFKAVYPEYGTMEDLEELIEELHDRGIRIIMDMVLNHTSHLHPWFVKSASADPGKYKDYYHWVPGKQGQLPNNWEAYFRGSVWEWSDERKAHYLHLFAKEQPDLNWENPEVREELYAILNWWLEKGVDGFRLDVINHVSKTPGYPSLPGEGLVFDGRYFMNGPRIHEYMREMNEIVFKDKDLLIVGEMPGADPEVGILYTAGDRKELGMIFQFDHMELDIGEDYWDYKSWSVGELKAKLSVWQSALEKEGWNSVYMNNHDQPRMVSRFGNDKEYHFESASLLGTLTHGLTGTPYIYQGEELGMTNIEFTSAGEARDISALNYLAERRAAGHPDSDTLNRLNCRGRDNARTPIQWDDSVHAGFSTAEPWIRVNPAYMRINAAAEDGHPRSVLNYYRKLIKVRKENPALVYGRYRLLESLPEVYAFTKELEEERLLVVLNISEKENIFDFSGFSPEFFVISNYVEKNSSSGKTVLRPYEAMILQL